MLGFNRSRDVLDKSLQREYTGIRLHWGVILCVAGLFFFGALMVYSSTTMFADSAHSVKEPSGHLFRHFAVMVIGVMCASLVYQVPMRVHERLSPLLFAVSILMLILIFTPLGHAAKGAARWVVIGPVSIQVSELVKITALMVASWFTVRQGNLMHSWTRGFIPMVFIILVISLLLTAQPDLGATVVIVTELLGVLFIGGLWLSIFLPVAGAAILGIVVMVWLTPWRLQRFLAYLDPWSEDHMLEKSYQLTHSLIAFGRGQYTGVGLGSSIEKLYYLPEAHTDFILAVVAEETGFLGVFFIMFLFYWLIRYAFEIGRQAIKLERWYSGLFAQGIAIWLAAQSIINIGVASGAFPTKGLTLPFVSFGGSAMIVSITMMGFLLRIDRENKELMRGGML